MKNTKNVYKNRFTDARLNDILTVSCSNYKYDLSKILKKFFNIKHKTNLKLLFNYCLM